MSPLSSALFTNLAKITQQRISFIVLVAGPSGLQSIRGNYMNHYAILVSIGYRTSFEPGSYPFLWTRFATSWLDVKPVVKSNFAFSCKHMTQPFERVSIDLKGPLPLFIC
uniref:Uncharacterized protein n=1 Tax=Schistocephalus solidus TaxID=70667 RepID=A0A0V0JC45_SCHSO